MATNNKGWTRSVSTKQKRRQQRIQRYWQNRETDNRLERLKRADAYDKEIERIYNRMLDEIQREIDSFYRKYADAEGITMAEAKRRASKLDMEEYARKAEQYVREKDFSKQANEEMKLYNLTMKVNRLELLKAQIGLEMVGSYDELEKLLGEKLTAEALMEIQRQAGILGDTIVANASKANLDALVNGSFHNATWSDRIWANQDLLRAELDKLLTRGIIQGKNPNELARELRKVIDTSVYNSERLLRTEMARVQTEAQRNSYKELGFTEFMYVACGNPDVCPVCKALDGQTFDLDKMEPGTNAPPMHPNCHCSTAPYEDEDDYEAWLSFLENGGTTEEWDAFGKREWNDSKSRSSDVSSSTGDTTGKQLFKGIGKSYSHRSEPKLTAAASTIRDSIGKYVSRLSKWSGRIRVVSRMRKKSILGVKAWNCDIIATRQTSDATLLHEILHSTSASHAGEDVFIANRSMEESSTQLLTEAICKENKIPFTKAYTEHVQILRDFKRYLGYDNELDFAIDLYDQPLDVRYEWLESKVRKKLLQENRSVHEMQAAIDYLRRLTG